MRASAIRRVTVLAAAAIAAGCDSSKSNGPSSITVVLAPSMSVTQGQTAVQFAEITRANFDKPVLFTVTGASNGISARITDSVPVTASAATLRVTASGVASPGTRQLTIHATGEGIAEQTATIDVVVGVAGGYTLATMDGQLNIARGGGGRTTVKILRVDGHADSVRLSVTGAPAGMEVTVDPDATLSNFASLQVTTTTAIAVGDYTVVVRGAAAGLDEQQTNLPVHVARAPATTSLTVTFCDGDEPSWFAYQNEGFLWKRVLATGSSFTFNATDRLGIAFVFAGSGGSQITTYFGSRDVFSPIDNRDCPGPKSLNGSVKGLKTGQVARIAMGPARVGANTGAFTLDGVPSRKLDLIATRGNDELTDFVPDKMIIRRASNPADGSTLKAFDFASTEAFSLSKKTLTIAGAASGEIVEVGNTFWSATSTYGAVQFNQVSGATSNLFSVPAASIATGDLHELGVSSGTSDGNRGRQSYTYYATTGDRTVTLGPALIAPQTSVVSTFPYVRMSGELLSQPSYDTFVRFGFFQQSSNTTRFVIVGVASTFLGATPSSWRVTVPDFGDVDGFNKQWMLQSGQATDYFADGYSGRTALLFGALPRNAETIRIAYTIKSTTTVRQLRSKSLAPLLRAQYFSR